MCIFESYTFNQNLFIMTKRLSIVLLFGFLVACSSTTGNNDPINTDPLYVEGAGVTDIDGNSYRTIVLGNQEWMAENLKTTRYRNGDLIQNITDDEAWADAATGAWSAYDNEEENIGRYGKLYNWFAVNDSRRICPEGWRVPTNQQYVEYISRLGSNANVVHSLRKTGSDAWEGTNAQATNTSGFTAIPGGRRLGGEFSDLGREGAWWTSSSSGPGNDPAQAWRILYEPLSRQYILINANATKPSGLSVRCIKE